MAEEMEGLTFELPEELEALDINEVSEEDVADIARETLQKRTQAHNDRVVAKTNDMEEDATRAGFIRRKFVVGVQDIRVNPPGTAYQDIVNGLVVTKQTKGYSVSCKRKYASGRVGRDIHYPLNI